MKQTTREVETYHVFEWDFATHEPITRQCLLKTMDYTEADKKAHEIALQWCEDELPADVEVTPYGKLVDAGKITAARGVCGDSDYGAMIFSAVKEVRAAA